MTNLQVEFNKLLETKRHNEATERQAMRELEETQRHSLQTEFLSKVELSERIRHQQQQDRETLRHDMATEAETAAHNRAMEQQARADNALKESIAKMENATKLYINERSLQNAKDIKQAELDFSATQNDLERQLKWSVEKMKNSVENVKLDQRRTELAQEQQRIDNALAEWQHEFMQKLNEFDLKKWTSNVTLGGVKVPYAMVDTTTKTIVGGSNAAEKLVEKAKSKSKLGGSVLDALISSAFMDSSKLMKGDVLGFIKDQSVFTKVGKFLDVGKAFVETMAAPASSGASSSAKQSFNNEVQTYEQMVRQSGQIYLDGSTRK